MGLTVRKQIRLEPEYARLIEQRAKALGMSFSEYARTALLQYESRVKSVDEIILHELAREWGESYQEVAKKFSLIFDS